MVKSQIDAGSRNGERGRHFPRRSGERRHKVTVDHKPWSPQHRSWEIALSRGLQAAAHGPGDVYSSWAKDGFYVLSGSLSACIITSVLLGDLQSLKYLLSSLQRKCLLSLLFKDKQASGMEVQVAVAALYGLCCVAPLFRHIGEHCIIAFWTSASHLSLMGSVFNAFRHWYYRLYSFPRTALTNCHNLGDLNHNSMCAVTVLPSETKVLAEPLLFHAVRWCSVHCKDLPHVC